MYVLSLSSHNIKNNIILLNVDKNYCSRKISAYLFSYINVATTKQ